MCLAATISSLVREHRAKPYVDGVNDCLTFVLDVLNLKFGCAITRFEFIESGHLLFRKVASPIEGDVIMFRLKDKWHIGYALDCEFFIHKHAILGVIQTRLRNQIFSRSLEGIYRLNSHD